jgi:hypothetical protein
MKLQKIILRRHAVGRLTSKMAAFHGYTTEDLDSPDKRQEIRDAELGRPAGFVNMLRIVADDSDETIEAIRAEGRLFALPACFCGDGSQNGAISWPNDAEVKTFTSQNEPRENEQPVRHSYWDHLAEMVPGVAAMVEAQRAEARRETAAKSLDVDLSQVELVAMYNREEITIDELTKRLETLKNA